MTNPDTSIISKLFESNRKWASDVAQSKPDFFTVSAKEQQPKVLWIGCADSRVPESVILACAPGDIFVHRNIANQFHLDDTSALSVLQYAVDHVGVEHVIVAGHTGCGGAAACYEVACGGSPVDGKSPIAHFLTPLVKLAKELGLGDKNGPTKDEALKLLIEENVRSQVRNIVNSETIQNIWSKGKNVTVHGWIYGLDTGLVRDLQVSQSLAGAD